MLGALSPLIQAITADNVNPLAVAQVEALGACFHLNGEVAGKVPDLLCRSASYRLKRLSHYVGWRGNDTATHMAKTAGGRAASVLCLAIMELYNEGPAGSLLYELSSKLLPAELNQSSRGQMYEVAKTLSKKLAAFGFGNHLALHVTRVREAYLNSGFHIPDNLLVFPTVETMTDFLHSLSRALQQEDLMLYFQGCKGAGYLLAIVMALCPDDCLVTVENEIIFQGERRSVIFDIQSASPTQFSIESILYTSGQSQTNPRIVSIEFGRRIFFSPINLKWDGCFSAALDLALATVGASFTVQVRISCVELICAIICSVSGTDLGKDSEMSHRKWTTLPWEGFRGLLGPDGLHRVRETLKRTFLCEPSFTILECDKAYNQLCVSLANAVPSTSCVCNQCFKDERLTNHWLHIFQYKPSCKVVEVVRTIDWLITRGIAASFVAAGQDTCIRMSLDRGTAQPSTGPGILQHIPEVIAPTTLIKAWHYPYFTVIDLHTSILGLLAPKRPQGHFGDAKRLGVSSGACSIFPSTIQNPLFQAPQCIEYVIIDGRFHDEHNYYQVLTTDKCSRRRTSSKSILESPIVPSGLGVHTNLTLTARVIRDELSIRTKVQLSTKTVSLDFYNLHLAYMGVNIAPTCGHDTRNPLSRSPVPVTTTSVLAPAGAVFDLPKGNKERKLLKIGMVLTHKNAEAQFLACVLDLPTLFQGDSCLDCAVERACEMGVEQVIQS